MAKTVEVKSNAVKVKQKEKRDGLVYVVEVGYSHNRTIAEALMKSLRQQGFEPVLRVDKNG